METLVEFYKRWGRLAKPYFKWQLAQFDGYLGSRIADIGCGMGNFTPLFLKKKLYLGIEPETNFKSEFAKRFNKYKNVKIAKTGDITLDKTVKEIRSCNVDTIICVNVLEHIKNDRRALANLIKCVESGNHICIIVPASPNSFGTLDKVAEHYRRYSKKSLIKLTNYFKNIEIIDLYYMNFPAIFGWYIKGRILKKKVHEDNNYILMNKILPLISYIEKKIKPPIGLSLVLILKKTEK